MAFPLVMRTGDHFRPERDKEDWLRFYSLLEFPGGLVASIQHFYQYGLGSIPGLGTDISHQTMARCALTLKRFLTLKTPYTQKSDKETCRLLLSLLLSSSLLSFQLLDTRDLWILLTMKH